MATLISELHTAVPGRARLRVAGLQGRRALKDAIERRIAGRDGIRSIEASAITGTVLVSFDPGRELVEIVGYIEVIVRSPLPKEAPKSSRAKESRLAPDGLWEGIRRWFEPAPPKPAVATPAQPAEAWHRMEASEALQFWNTPAAGLSEGEAAGRLVRYGPNLLDPPRQRSVFAHFLGQMASLPVLLLLGSAAVSIATGGIGDAIVITAVVALNASIGCALEVQAERTILSLLHIGQPQAVVIRDGVAHQIPADRVAPGDLLALRRGDLVPADGRLLAATDLAVDESALTGESVPVEKYSGLSTGDALADRVNMVYRGTLATAGSGLAVVVATGRHTEIGKIHSLISEAEQPETPLQRQMDALGTQLFWVTGAVAGAVFAAGILRGIGGLEMLRSAVSLAVAAVPEGLPTVATVALANSVRVLLRRNVIVRRLEAVEALGAIDVVCFDKTGTLTLNRMAVAAITAGRRRYEASGGLLLRGGQPAVPDPEMLRLFELCCLCSEVELADAELAGTPTEIALVRLAIDAGTDPAEVRRRYPLREIVHRAQGRNYMLTRHAAPEGSTLIAVKGNPAEVLDLCRWEAVAGLRKPLGRLRRHGILKENERMAGDALRVLGFAYGEEEGPAGLVWAGLAGIADPPREGIDDLVNALRAAGIRPVMITGDQAATARAVGQATGFNGSGSLDALDQVDVSALDPGELDESVLRSRIFARVSPARKLDIVRAFQKAGRTVAMTGDGINDGPALKAADAGIALAHGATSAAREAADIVVTEDNIHAMLDAIREGRRVHTNIRNAIHYMASTNGSELLLMLAAVAAGMGQPLNPRQLLWINLLTDVFPELALALAPAEPGSMKMPPADARRPVIGPPEYGRIGRETSLLAGSALGAYAIGLARYGQGPRASSMAFLALTSAQLLHGAALHGGQRQSNPYLVAGLSTGLVLLGLSQFVPGITNLLGAARIGASDALVCSAAALASFFANSLWPAGNPDNRSSLKLLNNVSYT